MSNQAFQTLKKLPIPLASSQCVLHKHELLLCGGSGQRDCYSYHTIKNEYKFICEYPSDVVISGYCVVKLVDNKNKNKDSNEITLLSFGGDETSKRHTLMMKYVSVWSSHSQIDKSNNYNKWIQFTDNYDNPIIIKIDHDFCDGMRSVIGGSNNHLLFITHYPNDIRVFDLNTFQLIKYDNLPTDYFEYHCFVLKSENGQEMIGKKIEMLLFCRKDGLLIEYDENDNTFQFHQLPVYKDIESFYKYAYVCINDTILFFGGSYGISNCSNISMSVHKYSIQEKTWNTFKHTLPSPLNLCAAILNEEDNDIHIIGGRDDKLRLVSTHMKTKVRIWDVSQLVIVYLFICFDEIKKILLINK
ncbi:hypothetical protein RFI_31490 [Reticulomyxa filosa]|uniref:Kelch motif family protein n=1 Tax=Reticulomyxa filosa TaxID=46433 RepID=X6LVH7_RETFI|nr:hypothetical protein RFI_31490 [Reticulomyxa filosa]|eukprot:ETO05908.1 hypothetical protein RFI_31490 [Reticulomyxa filosa]